MTTIINNETLNRLLRRGEGSAALTGFPAIDEIVDRSGRLLQNGQWIPLMDALTAILACAQRLMDAAPDPQDGVIGIDRDHLQRLLMGSLRLEPLQRELLRDKPPLPQRIDGERKVVKACHASATSIAAKLEKQPRTTFENYAEMLSRSPDPALTMRLLSHAGKDGPALMDANGPLAAIEKSVPPTLPAGATVELRVRVRRVDDRTDVAVVENLEALDSSSVQLLVHHAKECELRFDGESVERADLTAALYLDIPIRIRCAAECAILPALARRSSLTLVQVLEARDVMDGMHRTARQFQLELEGATEQR